jgi:NifU-like protein
MSKSETGPASEAADDRAAAVHSMQEGTVTQSSVTQASPTPARPQIDLSDKIDIIEATIAALRPTLQRDGGDCELVSIDGNRINVRLKGACIACQLSTLTLQGIQAKIMAAVGVPVRVIPVLTVH